MIQFIFAKSVYRFRPPLPPEEEPDEPDELDEEREEWEPPDRVLEGLLEDLPPDERLIDPERLFELL